MRQEPDRPHRRRIAVVVVAVAAVVVADRLRPEPLVRRADLVSQLHFAVTMQDLRTVVLLRRQLRGERPRPTRGSPSARPALGGRRRRGGAAGAACPLPAARLARMAVLAIGAGVAVVAVLRGTTPAVLVVVGVALYLLGLDAIEPLSQEIDHPDHTDGVPHRAGGCSSATSPRRRRRSRSPCSAPPRSPSPSRDRRPPRSPWPCPTRGRACGSVVSVVRDAADPLAPRWRPRPSRPSSPASLDDAAARADRHQHDPPPGRGDARVPDEPATAVRMAVLDVLRSSPRRRGWVRRATSGGRSAGVHSKPGGGRDERRGRLRRLAKTYGDAPALGPVDLDIAAGAAGRAARAQRQRQDDAAAHGRRAARRRPPARWRSRHPAGSLDARASPRPTSATSRCSTTT